jgi:hypothetical protein
VLQSSMPKYWATYRERSVIHVSRALVRYTDFTAICRVYNNLLKSITRPNTTLSLRNEFGIYFRVVVPKRLAQNPIRRAMRFTI